jgi:hypothetical protein
MTNLSDSQLMILSAAAQRPDRIALPLPANLKGGAAQKVVTALVTRGLLEEVDAERGDPVWRETGDGHGVTLVATDAALDALGIETAPADDQPADASAAEAGEEAPSGDAATTDAPEAPEAPTGADVGGEGEPEASGETPDAPQAEIDRLKLDAAAKAKAAEEAEAAAKAAKEAAKAAAKAVRDAEKAAGRAKPAAARKPKAAGEPSKQAQLIAMLERPEGATIAQIVEAFGWQRHTVHGAFAGALKKKLGLNVVSEKPEEGDRVYRIVAAA